MVHFLASQPFCYTLKNNSSQLKFSVIRFTYLHIQIEAEWNVIVLSPCKIQPLMSKSVKNRKKWYKFITYLNSIQYMITLASSCWHIIGWWSPKLCCKNSFWSLSLMFDHRPNCCIYNVEVSDLSVVLFISFFCSGFLCICIPSRSNWIIMDIVKF